MLKKCVTDSEGKITQASHSGYTAVILSALVFLFWIFKEQSKANTLKTEVYKGTERQTSTQLTKQLGKTTIKHKPTNTSNTIKQSSHVNK